MDTESKKVETVSIPRSLIYEEIDGQPIYYAGYKEVLAGRKTREAIVGSSKLQSLIIRALLKRLYAEVDGKEHAVFTNELGMHINRGNNFAGDVAIYTRERYEKMVMDEKYFDQAPNILIEVDVKADLSELKWEDYINRKNKKLHAWGTETIIWILSSSQQILIAKADQDWILRDWTKDVELIPGFSINIADWLTTT
jgi:Uma2 family endonuclease